MTAKKKKLSHKNIGKVLLGHLLCMNVNLILKLGAQGNENDGYYMILVQSNGSVCPWNSPSMKQLSTLEKIPFRKHAYSNILKINHQKHENFQIKNSDIFHISAQNIDCGYSLELPWWGDSNEYPQSMFLSRNKNKRAMMAL